MSYQEFVHAGLALLQVDAFNSHLLLAWYTVGCLNHSCGPTPWNAQENKLLIPWSVILSKVGHSSSPRQCFSASPDGMVAFSKSYMCPENFQQKTSKRNPNHRLIHISHLLFILSSFQMSELFTPTLTVIQATQWRKLSYSNFYLGFHWFCDWFVFVFLLLLPQCTVIHRFWCLYLLC